MYLFLFDLMQKIFQYLLYNDSRYRPEVQKILYGCHALVLQVSVLPPTSVSYTHLTLPTIA